MFLALSTLCIEFNSAPLPQNGDFWASGVQIRFSDVQTAKNKNVQKNFFDLISRPKMTSKKGERAVFEDMPIFPPYTPYHYNIVVLISSIRVTDPKILRK